MSFGNRLGEGAKYEDTVKERQGTINSLDRLEKDILYLQEIIKGLCTLLDPVLLPSSPCCGEEGKVVNVSSGIRHRIDICSDKIRELTRTLNETSSRVDL